MEIAYQLNKAINSTFYRIFMKQLPNLLVVDDIIENIKLLEAISQKVEVNLIKALSGPEALEKTKGIELALAIIDVRMPGMSGYELARIMNEERTTNKVPIIFLTANNELCNAERHGSRRR